MTKVMDREQRREALRRLKQLAAKEIGMTLIGGEPTLRPEFLIEAVRDASSSGFSVSLATNGRGLSNALIHQLAQAGLLYLAISVDSEEGAEKNDLNRALALLAVARQEAIIPVINTVITRRTDNHRFKAFVRFIIDAGCFVGPFACSPEVPNGVFSNASLESVPSPKQLRRIIPWLVSKKLTTGLVTVSFAYLWTLFRLGSKDGNTELWHCSGQFRDRTGARGRGYLTLDSDGAIGPCQEFPRVMNVLDIPPEQISLQALDERFSQVSQKCTGCLYNCYINEERIAGPLVLAELPTAIRAANIDQHGRMTCPESIPAGPIKMFPSSQISTSDRPARR